MEVYEPKNPTKSLMRFSLHVSQRFCQGRRKKARGGAADNDTNGVGESACETLPGQCMHADSYLLVLGRLRFQKNHDSF